MLTIKVTTCPEGWDEEKEEFVPPKEQTLQLEHSLVSLSKWEAKWKKPFLSNKDKTYEEVVDYIKFMTLTKNVDPTVYDYLDKRNVDAIVNYINDPMTATTFSNRGSKKANRQIITSEVIYCWMAYYGIPFECQKWHLRRLLTLIQVCNEESSPPRKMSRNEILRRNAELNSARRKKLNTRG